MRLPVRLSVLCLSTAAAPLAGQAAVGTVEFEMSTHLPASAAVPAGGDITIQMTMMSDGHRLAMEIVPIMPQFPAMAGMLVKMIFTPGIDSIHLGIILPPELAAAAGGGIGMRMDGPMSTIGSGGRMLAGLMDSIGKAMKDSLANGGAKPTSRSLGVTSTVAGINCEEWESVVMGDTTRTCVVPTPPGVQALQDQLKKMSGVASVMEQFPGMAEMEKSAYGGRAMTPIRADNRKTGLHMELVKVTPGAPAPARMELPEGLTPMPGMPGGGSPPP